MVANSALELTGENTLNLRVLIIESDRRTVDELQERFERYGIEAEVALSASVGLDILSERQMDAAIVDAELEEHEKWPLLTSLRQKAPTVPVVMINGWKKKGISKLARRAGAARFLASPVDAEKVITAISDVVVN